MFVPRALRLKGVKEAQKHETDKSNRGAQDSTSAPQYGPIESMQKANTSSTAAFLAPAQRDQKAPAIISELSKAPTSASSEYLAQLIAGIELIFTDYAHQDEDGAKWLQERHRTIDSEDRYVHLTAILSHPNIATLKPQATQMLLRQAMKEMSCQTLELSGNGCYIRRRPSTYPASFVPVDSFHVVDDDGLGFWDQRTIYVEPHIRHMCKTPAKVAHWLKEHGKLKGKWLPVQAVHTLYNSCAFVVLSGNVLHEDQWRKWRAAEKPDDWRIMTKVENLKRTAEYVALKEASMVKASLKGTLDGQKHKHDRQATGRKRPIDFHDTNLGHRTAKRKA